MKKADVEEVKSFASRRRDIARPAYGRAVLKQPRQSIDVATTNSDDYLQSQTGNRRFWPLTVTAMIDLEKLAQDRLQLWGEAARYETLGEPITLAKELWGDAAIEQDRRRTRDPWEDTLPEKLALAGAALIHCENLSNGLIEERVASATVLSNFLDVPVGRQTTRDTMRLSVVMKRLGWDRLDHKITIGGQRARGFVRRVPANAPAAGTTPRPPERRQRPRQRTTRPVNGFDRPRPPTAVRDQPPKLKLCPFGGGRANLTNLTTTFQDFRQKGPTCLHGDPVSRETRRLY